MTRLRSFRDDLAEANQRQIEMQMFGAVAIGAEFGPESTGASVREAIQPYLSS